MIKLVIFDLDGVLVDTPDMHFETFAQAYYDFTNISITKKEHDLDFNGRSTKTKLKILGERDNLESTTKQNIWNKKQDYTFDFIREKICVDETKIELLRFLKNEGYKIACASNAIYRTVESILEKMQILEYFDLILSNENVNNPKPSAEIYLKTMIDLNCNPSNTLIIEDSKVGYESAISTNAEVLRVVNAKEVTLEKIKNHLDSLVIKSLKQKYKNSKLTVVIPMAGAGSRFEVAGYTFPKPLIEVKGKPMIQLVLETLNIEAKYIFIVRKEHIAKYSLKEFLNQIAPGCEVITTDGLTEGSACTVLLAKEFIDNDNPILMANSDQYIEWDAFEFMKNSINNNLDGSILTFEATHPKWSFVKIDNEGFVTEVAEKKPISNIATVGIYWWLKGSDFVKYAEQMIEKDIRVNNEFYICPVFNEAIAEDKKIGIFNVDEMWGIGTPEDLNYFLSTKK